MFMRAVLMTTAAVAAALISLGVMNAVVNAADRLPDQEIMLPEGVVPDRFYSYLIGLVEANVCGVVDDVQLKRVLRERRGKTSIPFEKIKEIRRECVTGTTVRDVSIAFKGDLETPVPYSILGYHPGSVDASKTMRFLEWYTPFEKIAVGGRESVELSQVSVFGVYEGWVIVDIDAWIDNLLGGLLDDTRIIVLVLFKYKGDWHALAAGYDRQGNGRSGIFNFKTNKILFPTPRELQALAPYYRNFVVRIKHLTAPAPPANKWKSAK
jgi:hypothetical protein